MSFKLDVLKRLDKIEAGQSIIINRLALLATQERIAIMTIAELQTQVEKNTSLEESAAQTITGIAAQLAALKNDPAAIQALADELTKSAGDLSAAIVASTPAAPAA